MDRCSPTWQLEELRAQLIVRAFGSLLCRQSTMSIQPAATHISETQRAAQSSLLCERKATRCISAVLRDGVRLHGTDGKSYMASDTVADRMDDESVGVVGHRTQRAGWFRAFSGESFAWLPRMLPLAGPPLTVAAVLSFALYAQARNARYGHATDFIQIGRYFAQSFGLGNLATSRFGYDGQFFYYMARFPGQMPAGGYDDRTLRYSRMLYPLLTRLVALGHVRLLPWAMLGIDVTAISATVLLLAWLLRSRGLSPWWALVAGLYCGQVLALFRALSDPLAICFLALALVCVARREWLGAGAALGLGMLTRESTLLFVACLAVPLALERRWWRLAAYGALALMPYALWEVLLYLWLGQWGWHQTAQSNAFVPLPFAGLAATPTLHLQIQMVLLACMPALAGIVFGLLSLKERQPWVAQSRDPLALGVAVSAVVYGAAVLMQPGVHWLDIWEPLRLTAPLIVLLPLLMPSQVAPKPARRAWYGLLALMLFSVTLVF